MRAKASKDLPLPAFNRSALQALSITGLTLTPVNTLVSFSGFRPIAGHIREMVIASAAKRWGNAEFAHTQVAYIYNKDGRSMSDGEAVDGVELHRYADVVSSMLVPNFRLYASL